MAKHVPVKLSKLETRLGDRRITVRQRLKGNVKRIISSFRQIMANEGLSLGPIKLKNVDLNRVHAIVSEIDGRRVFYDAMWDEIADSTVKSVASAREKIRDLSKGIWSEPAAEHLVQLMLDRLALFETRMAKLEPLSDRAGAGEQRKKWHAFETCLVDLRLDIWSIVALLKLSFGSIINPLHLPPEILEQVKSHPYGLSDV